MGLDAMIWDIDPERISEHNLGGPFFRAFKADGNCLICAKTGKVWESAEVSRAWMEGRNCAPIGEAA